jgi:hypothetical protein
LLAGRSEKPRELCVVVYVSKRSRPAGATPQLSHVGLAALIVVLFGVECVADRFSQDGRAVAGVATEGLEIPGQLVDTMSSVVGCVLPHVPSFDLDQAKARVRPWLQQKEIDIP